MDGRESSQGEQDNRARWSGIASAGPAALDVLKISNEFFNAIAIHSLVTLHTIKAIILVSTVLCVDPSRGRLLALGTP